MDDPVVIASVIGNATLIYLAWVQRKTKRKVDETHTQTTQNGHKHQPPTIPDLLSTLSRDVNRLHTRMDRHEDWHRKN